MRILGIDPGIHTGIAIIEVKNGDLFLLGADLAHPRTVAGWADPDYVVIEKPVIYPHAKENPNDLLTLAIQVGELKAYCETGGWPVTLVEARTWKGQVPKSVTIQRVCARFPNARKLLDHHALGLQNNVADAIGLALWHAGRLMVKR